MYGIECDEVEFKEIAAYRNFAEKNVIWNTSTNKKSSARVWNLGRMGSNGLLGTGFYFGLVWF